MELVRVANWLFGQSDGWLIVLKQIRLHWEAATVNISDKLKINSARARARAHTHTHTHIHTQTSRPRLDYHDVLCENTVYLA